MPVEASWRWWIGEAWRGKSISRTCMNLLIQERIRLGSLTLDLGGGESPSYYHWLGFEEPPQNVVRVDINPRFRPSLIASLEKGLPFKSKSFPQVFLFNVLEHIFEHRALLEEIFRVLSPGGRLFLWVPFLIGIHSDPYDFYRYTDVTLTTLFQEAGFHNIRVEPCSGLFLVTADLARLLVPTRVFKTFLTTGALAGNALLSRLAPNRNRKFVLGYFCEAVK